MPVFKHRDFARWAKSSGVTDKHLLAAVNELSNGLHDGCLGSGLYKKRVAARGRGKRGSFRVLLAFQQGSRALFVYGYPKNVKATLSPNERDVFRHLAKTLLTMDEAAIAALTDAGRLIEVT